WVSPQRLPASVGRRPLVCDQTIVDTMGTSVVASPLVRRRDDGRHSIRRNTGTLITTVPKMTRNRYLRLSTVVSTALMLQGCAIHNLPTRKAETTLPHAFRPGDPDPEATGEESTARVEWKDFFSDPLLVSLIDTAVANNKEVNIMIQRISAAQNEI